MTPEEVGRSVALQTRFVDVFRDDLDSFGHAVLFGMLVRLGLEGGLTAGAMHRVIDRIASHIARTSS